MRAAKLISALTLVLLYQLAAAGDPVAPAGKSPPSDEFVISKEKLDNPDEARKALVEAEDRFYARFNELNKDDQYDITCRMEAFTGQRLKTRVCEPRFVQEAQREKSAGGLTASRPSSGGTGLVTSTADTRSQKFQELQQRMQHLASEDAELQNALVERSRLEGAYKALLKK